MGGGTESHVSKLGVLGISMAKRSFGEKNGKEKEALVAKVKSELWKEEKGVFIPRVGRGIVGILTR